MKYDEYVEYLIFQELGDTKETKIVYDFYKKTYCDLKEVYSVINFLKWVKSKCRIL